MTFTESDNFRNSCKCTMGEKFLSVVTAYIMEILGPKSIAGSTDFVASLVH